ncbi:MAG TPA: hypothetical protein VI756_07250 [Blastocatellia bacterium]
MARVVRISIKNGPRGPVRGRNRDKLKTPALDGTFTVTNHTARPLMLESGVLLGTGQHRTKSGLTLTRGDVKHLLNRKAAVLTAKPDAPAASSAPSGDTPSPVAGPVVGTTVSGAGASGEVGKKEPKGGAAA